MWAYERKTKEELNKHVIKNTIEANYVNLIATLVFLFAHCNHLGFEQWTRNLDPLFGHTYKCAGATRIEKKSPIKCTEGVQVMRSNASNWTSWSKRSVRFLYYLCSMSRNLDLHTRIGLDKIRVRYGTSERDENGVRTFVWTEKNSRRKKEPRNAAKK